MKRIIHHSRFSANPFGHGGERRTTQILEYYQNEGYEIETLVLKQTFHFKFHYLLKSFLILVKVYGLKDWYSIKRFLKWWKKIYELLPGIEKSFDTDAQIFVWESTSDSFYFLPYVAKKKGLTVFAYPHNIESLVKEQNSSITGKLAPKGYFEEIKVYNVCDKIFSISRFDHQLFQLFGLNSEYFPYYPPNEVEYYLKSIKLKRESLFSKNNHLKHYLIAGTVYNPPTRMGMEILIEWINNNDIPNCTFTVAGYGTDIFRNGIKNNHVKVLGTLSHHEMETIMIESDALLIYQIATTGVLTRVYEFQIAGIPVILNADAAYSFSGEKGVFVYNDFNSISEYLQQQFADKYAAPN